MELIKKKSKQTFINKNGEERHYINYYLVLDNGTKVQIKACFDNQQYLLRAFAKDVK